ARRCRQLRGSMPRTRGCHGSPGEPAGSRRLGGDDPRSGCERGGSSCSRRGPRLTCLMQPPYGAVSRLPSGDPLAGAPPLPHFFRAVSAIMPAMRPDDLDDDLTIETLAVLAGQEPDP